MSFEKMCSQILFAKTRYLSYFRNRIFFFKNPPINFYFPKAVFNVCVFQDLKLLVAIKRTCLTSFKCVRHKKNLFSWVAEIDDIFENAHICLASISAVMFIMYVIKMQHKPSKHRKKHDLKLIIFQIE